MLLVEFSSGNPHDGKFSVNASSIVLSAGGSSMCSRLNHERDMYPLDTAPTSVSIGGSGSLSPQLIFKWYVPSCPNFGSTETSDIDLIKSVPTSVPAHPLMLSFSRFGTFIFNTPGSESGLSIRQETAIAAASAAEPHF